MQLNSESFTHEDFIPARCAFGALHATEHMQLSDNLSPQLSWAKLPDHTHSLVLLCIDKDVPSSLDNFNQEGKTIDLNLPRVDFGHWAMVDIAPIDGSVAEGQCSDGITAGGKSAPHGPPGSRQGINDYTAFMADNPDMRGDYFGYDGPCPPWNDERVHRYHFELYAIDLERCPVEDRFTAADVLAAIDSHVLEKVSLVGKYSLNPSLSPDQAKQS